MTETFENTYNHMMWYECGMCEVIKINLKSRDATRNIKTAVER